ncbi:MAG TPA: GNAT family N-acetyltransferase [Steroidobacteraceae bacterium]|jgi:GNAT superfamily N-acetyltransferase
MTIRPAHSADAPAIAQLHASSWQTAYRGILLDAFLDGPLLENRHALWRDRLSLDARADQFVVVDEQAGEIRGFACAFFDADPEWGTLLDNLHVVPKLKGRGLGRQLISATAAAVMRNTANPQLHLWAYEQNRAARRFYERLGGILTATEEEPALDGSRVRAVRYCWRELSELVRHGVAGEERGTDGFIPRR